MNTFRRLAMLAVVISAAACSSSAMGVDEAHTARVQPSFENTAPATDSSANRGGGNLMGGN